MQLLLLAIRRAQNLETIIEDGFEDNEMMKSSFFFFCGRDFKTKQGPSTIIKLVQCPQFSTVAIKAIK